MAKNRLVIWPKIVWSFGQKSKVASISKLEVADGLED